MNPKLLALLFALCWAALARAADGDKPVPPPRKPEDPFAHTQKLFTKTRIESKELPEEMSLAEYLATLETWLPKGTKLSLRLDEQGLGKDLPRFAQARLKFIGYPNKMTLDTALRWGVSRAGLTKELDCALRPNAVVLTRPQLAAHVTVYDIRDVVEHIPPLWPELVRISKSAGAGNRPSDGAAMLARLLGHLVEMQPWETIEIQNGTRLIVRASPRRQEEVADALTLVRRLADLAVVMHARLYEVDRAFYTREVVPLLKQDEDEEERSLVVPLPGALLEKILKQKLLQESELTRLRPGQQSGFLSRYSMFRFASGLPGEKEKPPAVGAGLAGVGFEVRPRVSPDRCFLRLEIVQNVKQLAATDKTRKLDLRTGKEMEVEAPNLQESTLRGTGQVGDSVPILMPVGYRPPGKEGQDKVWLLVARPTIWIEEEQREYQNKENPTLQPLDWNKIPTPEKQPPGPPPLPLDEQTKQVLQSLVTNVLTDPDLKDSRAFYGTEKDRTFTLSNEGEFGWPKDFHPETHGYKLVEVRLDPFKNQRKVLGIRLDRFDLKQKEKDSSSIQVGLFNAGGTANGGPIGACLVTYRLKQMGQRWTVEGVEIFDP